MREKGGAPIDSTCRNSVNPLRLGQASLRGKQPPARLASEAKSSFRSRGVGVDL
jgi:hypothetical protein